jgi:nucleolar protein 56
MCAPLVRLTWDWRMARVIDADGCVVDDSVWTGVRGVGAVVDRLEQLGQGRMTAEARALEARFSEAIQCPTTDVEWPALDADEQVLFEAAARLVASRGVARAAAEPDRRLEHLVHALEEMRATHNTLESRLVEWAGMFQPELDLDENRSKMAGMVLASDAAFEEVGVEEWKALVSTAEGVEALAAPLQQMETAVRELATEHLPSLSALLGPVLAAKLCVTAHGRARLARLPASTIQVLGAENAFFSHLRHGTSPPKHGHIFQHPWIGRSPKWTRGSISRMVAAKAAIAVRLDHFGGAPWTTKEVAAVEAKVGEIRARKARR